MSRSHYFLPICPDFGFPTLVSLFDHSDASLVTVFTSRSVTNNSDNQRLNSTPASKFNYVSISPLTLPADFRGYFLVSLGGPAADLEEEKQGEEEDAAEEEQVCIPWGPHSPRSTNFGYPLNNADGRLFYFPRVIVRRQVDGFDDVATNIPNDAAATNAAYVSFRFRLKSEEKEGQERNVDEEEENEEKESAMEDWVAQSEEEDRRLAMEAAKFGDVLYVDVVDTYENLPSKLILATKALTEHYDFDFFLKADDDVFLHLESLYDAINDYGLLENNNNDNKQKSTTYLGRFRRDWAVMRAGKWAETRFQGNGYPPFACGATYGLSSGAASWLAANAASLARYQGEDVSMGFWMAALGAEVVDDVRFVCGKNDDDDPEDDSNHGFRFNAAQLSGDEMRREHKLARASSLLKEKLHKN